MKEVGKIWMNGKLVPFKNAKIHVLTHALHYSTAVFEGIRCYNTPNGRAIFRLPEHVDRFFDSSKLYSMKIRYTKKQIIDAIIKTVKASGLKECYIRPIAYYGYGSMGLTPTLNKVDVSIHVGNGRWVNRKPVNFLDLNARFQNGLELIPNLNLCNQNVLQIIQMQL